MTQALNTKFRFTAIAGALAVAATLFTAPASYAGDRGDRWDRDRNHRVERHYDRGRQVHRPGYRYGYRYVRPRRHRDDHILAPVVLGVGLGILTYAIIDSHRAY